MIYKRFFFFKKSQKYHYLFLRDWHTFDMDYKF
jgi:hypothetical protein